MDKSIRLSRSLFAAVFVGLGIVGLISGDFASVWQRIPIADLPYRSFFAYLTAAVELLCGLGLLFRATLRPASILLFVFTVLWVILLKLPAVVVVPSLEATWLGFGEIGAMVAGAWVLFASHSGLNIRFLTGESGTRSARVFLALCLPMIGLSHFFYADVTAGFVPRWIPFPLAFAYLTGAGSLAACLGISFRVVPRLAATMEAAMLGVITLCVWGIPLLMKLTDRGQWTAFLISSTIALGVYVVADSYRSNPWLGSGRAGGGVSLD
ncbi:MAG TPA: DoxX family membrane protein [Gammaproteobacteria bacterium]|jgi:uncharacterized membrane protein